MQRTAAAAIMMILVGCTATSPDARDPRPSSEPAASYTVFPPVVRFGDTPEAILRNEGDVALEYEHEFLLEISVDGTWRSIPLPDSYNVCRFPLTSLLLHPGASRSQEVEVCDEHGRTPALSPGSYRVTKIVRTIAPHEDAEPIELKRVATFEVAQPDAEVPPPSECDVLCMSDTRVQRGDTVRVSFTPPRGYTWGVASEIHVGTTETFTQIGYLYGWYDDKKLRTVWPGSGRGFEDIGFGGHASWSWVIPEKLGPGVYAISKDGIRGRPPAPLKKRLRVWSVAFEVTG